MAAAVAVAAAVSALPCQGARGPRRVRRPLCSLPSLWEGVRHLEITSRSVGHLKSGSEGITAAPCEPYTVAHTYHERIDSAVAACRGAAVLVLCWYAVRVLPFDTIPNMISAGPAANPRAPGTGRPVGI